MICELSRKMPKNSPITEKKNRIMIVRGQNNPQVTNDVRELYRFLRLTAGNYRNAIYVDCGCGFLMVADQDGKPVLFSVRKFYELTGEYPQKDETCGVMSRQAFENMYRSWLLWNTDGMECSVCAMYEKMKTEVL